MKYLLSVLILLSGALSMAQSTSHTLFAFKSTLSAVNETNYYNLLLSPEAIALCKNENLSDIRIFDQAGKEIPYILRAENPSEEHRFFTTFNLVTNKFVDSTNLVVIDNAHQDNLNQFCITLKNADVNKRIQLRGSNNGKQWFIVKQDASVDQKLILNETEEMIIYDFPSGKYRYYQLKISNAEHAPLEIVNIGKYQYSEILGKFSTINLGQMEQKDSAKYSYLLFPNLNYNYKIDRMVFTINNQSDYYRSAVLYSDSIGSQSTSFIFSSKPGGNELILNNFVLGKQSYISISNKDNEPLKVSSALAYQRCRYLTLKLEKGAHYTLYGGNSSLSKADYDLNYFKTSIPQQLSICNMDSLVIIKPIPAAVVPAEKVSFFKPPLFLWIVIGVVGIFLLIICYNMIKDLGK